MKALSKIKRIACIGWLIGTIGLMGGCGTTPHQQEGMTIGALGGGAIGGAVGGWSGAAIGAAGGAAIGALVTSPRHCRSGRYQCYHRHGVKKCYCK